MLGSRAFNFVGGGGARDERVAGVVNGDGEHAFGQLTTHGVGDQHAADGAAVGEAIGYSISPSVSLTP